MINKAINSYSNNVNNLQRIFFVYNILKYIFGIFYKQHFAGIGKKIKQMLGSPLRLNFCYLKIIRILHPRYHLKIIRHSLKNNQTNNCACIHEIIRLIIMKMKMKMRKKDHIAMTQIGLHLGNCINMMMLICIKQQLSNI